MTSLLIADSTDVAVSYSLAARWRRLAAFAIDSVLFAAVSIPRFIFGLVGMDALGAVISTVLMVALLGLAIWLLAVRGQTPGKIVMRVAIVDPIDGLPPGFLRASVIRGGPQAILGFVLPLVALIYLVVDGVFIFSSTRRCLHDRLARTVVIAVESPWP